MSVSAEARELAGKTAAEIRRRGWVQGTMADTAYGLSSANCRVCLVGGIAAALTGDPDDGHNFRDGFKVFPQAGRELVDEILLRVVDYDRSHPGALDQVITWNDSGSRTGDQVLTLLDSIAGAA